MEIAEKVLSIAQVIYTQCEHVKYCQSQCKRLGDRIQTLMRPIMTLKAQTPQQISPQVEKTLKGLVKTLEKARELVTKYSQKTWLQKFFQASDIKEEFMQVNMCLGDAAQGLSLLLQAEQQQSFLKVFQQDICNKEDDKDIKADKAFLEELLASSKETRDAVDDVHNSVKNVDGKVEKLTQMVKTFVEESSMKQDNTVPRKEVVEIMIENLIKTPWTLLTETRSHVIYKGEYHKCPVAIKVFQNPVITCAMTVRDIFKKEIETMKIFESPNILRMYGICIDERESRPHFSIVMEYCRYGTLRDVLTKNPELSWDDRIQMALDVARGVYRLHHTEVKPRLHGSISSIKFFVAEGYRVKLSGFELCKTESSIKRNYKEKKSRQVSPSAYTSPQGLVSLSHIYDLHSEIYSLGIVLWEIATGKIPFEGCSTKDIYQKVYKEHYQDPLGEDCPSKLQEVINQCRAFEPSQRPSAEEIVDSLSCMTK